MNVSSTNNTLLPSGTNHPSTQNASGSTTATSSSAFQQILQLTAKLAELEYESLAMSLGDVPTSLMGVANSSASSSLPNQMPPLFDLLSGVSGGALSSTPTPLSANGPTTNDASSFSSIIDNASQKYNIPTDLLNSVIQQESAFNPQSVSDVGAMGLMQLMPETAKTLGVSNPFDPAQNVDGGAKYLRQLLNQFSGDVPLALAAYNAGPGAVQKYGGVPPYSETRAYVASILKRVQPSAL